MDNRAYLETLLPEEFGSEDDTKERIADLEDALIELAGILEGQDG